MAELFVQCMSGAAPERRLGAVVATAELAVRPMKHSWSDMVKTLFGEPA